MQPDKLAEVVKAFDAEWASFDGALKAQAVSRQRDRQAVERKIANLVDVVSDGGASPALLAKLRELEAAQRALSETESPSPQAVPFSDAGGLAKRYALRIAELTQSLTEGDDPEALEVARSLIDQVVIHPCTDDDPAGIEFIVNLIDLLRAAGLGEAPTPGAPASHGSALALFVSSVKEGPGAEPLALGPVRH